MWLTTSEHKHVMALVPKDYVGATPSCAIVNMGMYDSAVMALEMGNLANADIVYVYEYTAHGTTGQAIPAVYRMTGSTTSTCDVMGSRTTLASTGLTITADYDSMGIFVELKSADLDDGYPYAGLVIGAVTGAGLYASYYILKPRYVQNSMSTATVVS